MLNQYHFESNESIEASLVIWPDPSDDEAAPQFPSACLLNHPQCVKGSMMNLEHPRPHLREPKKLEKTIIKIDVKKKHFLELFNQ